MVGITSDLGTITHDYWYAESGVYYRLPLTGHLGQLEQFHAGRWVPVENAHLLPPLCVLQRPMARKVA